MGGSYVSRSAKPQGTPPRLLLGSPGSLLTELRTSLPSGPGALCDGPCVMGPATRSNGETDSGLLGFNLPGFRCQRMSSEGSYIPESTHVSPGRK